MSSELKNIIKNTYKYSDETMDYICGYDCAYDVISIKKHNSGERKLRVPQNKLQIAQKYVLKYLQKNIEDNLYLDKQYAYRKNRNSIQYARVHLKRKYIIKYDLKDYFEQITFPRIMGVLIKNGIEKDDAIFIAQLACYRKNRRHIALAQGSSLSPFLFNLVSTPVDSFFMNYSKRYSDIKYSRYADDICLSTNDYNAFMKIKNDYSYIFNSLKNKNFILNDKKYRIYEKGRKMVGGVKINDKLNVRKEFLDIIKLNLFYASRDFERTKHDYCIIHNKHLSASEEGYYYEKSIRGKILYLSNVKGNDDAVVLKYKKIYNSIPNFVSKFDIRKDCEKKIFALEYLVKFEDGSDGTSNGTIFRVKEGLVTCYHNLFDFESHDLYYYDYCIVYRNKGDKVVRKKIKIDTKEISKNIILYEETNKVIIDEKNDFVFLSNDFLSNNIENYNEFVNDTDYLSIENRKDIYKPYFFNEISCFGYSRYNSKNPIVNSLKSKSKYDQVYNRFHFENSLGEGASGGPVLFLDKVIGVYCKGQNRDTHSEASGFVLFLDSINNFSL